MGRSDAASLADRAISADIRARPQELGPAGLLLEMPPTIGTAALLWFPAWAFDLSEYPTSPGGGLSLYAVDPLLWVAQDAILLVVVSWLAARRSRWTWLDLATAVSLLPLRTFLIGAPYFIAAGVRMLADRRP